MKVRITRYSGIIKKKIEVFEGELVSISSYGEYSSLIWIIIGNEIKPIRCWVNSKVEIIK